MCLVKTLLDKIQWEKNLVKEKEYTYLIIRIMDASLKTLQGKSSRLKPCEEKKVHRVLTPLMTTLIQRLESLFFKLVHHFLESCSW